MSQFAKVSVGAEARTELHDKLSLTGAEVSLNHLPAGGCVPFVHSHKKNEEIYGVLAGKGKAVIGCGFLRRQSASFSLLRIPPSALYVSR